MVKPRRRELYELVRKLEGWRMAHLEGGRVVELLELLAHSLRNLWPAVPRIDAPQAGSTIKNFASVRSPIMHARGFGQQARRVFELTIGGKGQPQRFELGSGRGGSRHTGTLRRLAVRG